MGMGSNKTPLWVDEEIIDREKIKKIWMLFLSLKIYNRTTVKLKKKIKELEYELSQNKK